MTILFHTSSNLFSASAVGSGTMAVVMTAGVVLVSLTIPRRYWMHDFSSRARHTL